MDYDVEMLKTHFKEKELSPDEIEYLLNTNPFTEDYVYWEKRTKNFNFNQ